MFHFRLKPLRAALLLVLGGSAQAATITVNSNADPGVPNDDLCTLCEVVETPMSFCTAIIEPSQLKTSESDILQSAFFAAGADG